jgi:hypothetical protein
MYYYMIYLIQFPSPHVPTKDYSHMMVGDEIMAVEIVVESMSMMNTKKTPSTEWRERERSTQNPCFLW